jgi:transcriptional regulator with XRE-family HTH domain
MARNFKELQAKMDPASREDNKQRVREELQRMALDDLRNAQHLTQADIAEMLDVPQSSVSRIERRADMYLSTLRDYIHAVGGELRIQAVFPDGRSALINRFGDYDYTPYEVDVQAESDGLYRLVARSRDQGVTLSTRQLKLSGLTKTMRALHLPEPQITSIRESLQNAGGVLRIGGMGGGNICRVFMAPELVAAGFEETVSE